MEKTIYLDRIAATPVHSEVLKSMLPYIKEKYGNPQSLHSFGQEARSAVENAREKTARLINADPDEVILTSSGSEANNFALKGSVAANRKKGSHIVLSSIEHPSLLQPAKNLEKAGLSVTMVPVDKWGRVDPDDVKKALTEKTIFVSVQTASNEVGTIEPIEEIARICREKEVVFFTDAVAAVGAIPVDVKKSNVDALSLAGNMFYGPKGTGALYIRKGLRILPFIEGGNQEGGRRAGTENVAGIVGLGKAAEIAEREISFRTKHVKPLRDHLIQGMLQNVEHVVLTGHPEERLPYHASFCVEFVEGESMLLNLDMQGISVSSGSACASKSLKASHVLLAMGLDHALAQGSLVFSLIDGLTAGDIDHVLSVFPSIIDRLRKMSPLYTEFLEEMKK
ncbi:MAG: aminotransferase class V-fold PLP-dependent enzyme [Candidatus Aminicenantes bacterium]|nr:aminotransferase class V-fold PLP-dependent enzyme [Candidatus Aminicenantes bacterium]